MCRTLLVANRLSTESFDKYEFETFFLALARIARCDHFRGM